jgi:hypothetical protein
MQLDRAGDGVERVSAPTAIVERGFNMWGLLLPGVANRFMADDLRSGMTVFVSADHAAGACDRGARMSRPATGRIEFFA